jgi:hypothetical protein
MAIVEGFFVSDSAGPRPVLIRKQRPEKFLAVSPEVLALSTAEIGLVIRLGLAVDYRNRVYGTNQRICQFAGVPVKTFYAAKSKVWKPCDGGVFVNPFLVSRCSWKSLGELRSEWLEGESENV